MIGVLATNLNILDFKKSVFSPKYSLHTHLVKLPWQFKAKLSGWNASCLYNSLHVYQSMINQVLTTEI